MKRLRVRISGTRKRGSFRGAIRIPLHALLFLFNDLAFPLIPRKSWKFLTLLFSISTAPNKQYSKTDQGTDSTDDHDLKSPQTSRGRPARGFHRPNSPACFGDLFV